MQLDFSGHPVQPQLTFRVEAANAVAVDQPLAICALRVRCTGMRESKSMSYPPANPQLRACLTGSGTYDLGTNAYTATLQGRSGCLPQPQISLWPARST